MNSPLHNQETQEQQLEAALNSLLPGMFLTHCEYPECWRVLIKDESSPEHIRRGDKVIVGEAENPQSAITQALGHALVSDNKTAWRSNI